MTNILIDSDVIIDFLLDRKPFSEEATEIMSLCYQKSKLGFVTPVIIANSYYVLRKGIGHDAVLAAFKNLLTFIDVLSIDKSVIIEAITSDFSDFEDALQNYAAENATFIEAIITRNTHDYKHSQMPVFTPQDFLTLL